MGKKRKVVHSYATLCELYLSQKEEIKELQLRANTYYNLCQQRKKEIEEIKELHKYKDKELEDLKIINTALYEKLYSKGVNKK